mgnify:FL=1
MSEKVVLVTGAAGGIGQALCREFTDAGWRVIGTDLEESPQLPVSDYLSIDLDRLCVDDDYCSHGLASLIRLLPGRLDCLINNAAVQVVAPVDKLDADAWKKTLNVNLLAPFILVRGLLGELTKAEGSVINIASVHAEMTKPGFAAYASSKAGLVGLTRSLAVELGSTIRVNAIAPAAVSTPMLIDGFNGKSEALAELAGFHPAQCIGRPEDLAQLALYLAGESSKFLNGAVIGFDGGIASRLHDPG